MKKTQGISVLLIIMMSACSDIKNEKIPIYKVSPVEINKNFQLLNPIELKIDGDIIWISDYSAERMITAMDIKTGDCLTEFLHKGKGPGEAMPPVNIYIDNDKIYFHARGSSTILSGDKSEILNGETKILSDRLLLPQTVDKCIPIYDSVILASGAFDNGRFAWIDTRFTDSMVYVGTYPDFWNEEKNYTNIIKSRFHQSTFLKNSQTKLIAIIGPYTITLAEISQQNVKIIKEILLHNYEYDYINSGQLRYSKKRPGIVQGAVSATANNKHIYILFDLSTDTHTTYPLLWVFDWEGNHIRNIDPGTKIRAITADQKDEYLYGLSNLEDEKGPDIVRLSL